MKRFLLMANGPGELWGWVRPLATALHRRGHAVDLQLLPCPFASGREALVASRLPVRVRPPANALSLLASLDGADADAIVHLGGDLLFGRWAARRGIPLAAYTYGPKKGLDRCRALFTAFDAMAFSLKGHPAVVGDLVASALELDGPSSSWERRESPRIVFYPGSRPFIRRVALPFVAELARALRQVYPDMGLRTLMSPFSDDEEFALWRERGLCPTLLGAGAVLGGADFAVTQPGTNTLELLHRAVPAIVAVPFSFLRQVPLGGVKQWIAAIPGLGAWGKERYLRARAARTGFLALPNMIAGRALLRESVGDFGPRELAALVVEGLDDGAGLETSRRGLRALADESGVDGALRLASSLEEMISS
ncbi:cdisaccharide synthetase [Aminithiophilus ramosus]|uniref:Lipid-A-disaccharide synthase n=1 Tax=Aminithiophilus ramosus TaxID=3029084 RepID=A0A9Q7AMF4_9BACT|nr:cdisaccharide synthetase [Aminithiophilus ramosus]QTX31622.1 cdisaccharide synthetase [Aminithiophilus ramosus]